MVSTHILSIICRSLIFMDARSLDMIYFMFA